MGVFKHLCALGEFLFDQFQHLAEEGAGVADGRALADAGGEGDGVRAALDEQAGAQGGGARLPGQPPQLVKPTSSMGSEMFWKAPSWAASRRKSVVPGQ